MLLQNSNYPAKLHVFYRLMRFVVCTIVRRLSINFYKYLYKIKILTKKSGFTRVESTSNQMIFSFPFQTQINIRI